MEKIYRQLGHFQTLTNKVKAGHQHIRIGAPPVLATKLLTPLVSEFAKENACSIDLTTGNHAELCQALLDNELDLAITFGRETPAGISHRLLLQQSMTVLLSHEHHKALSPVRSSLSLSTLLSSDIGLIALDERDPLGMRLHDAIAAHKEDFAPTFRVRSYSAGAELAKLGSGIAIVDPWTAQQYALEPNLARVTLTDNIDCSVSLLTSDVHPMSIASRQFLETLSDLTSP